MILYEKYKKFLNDELSNGFKLTRAWFTSFNLSPEFFESYILPPLLGQTDEIPRSFIQFEALIVDYAKRHKKGMDIRVFHDASMPIEGIKKTTIPFHGVLHEKGLFHPKVALFVFQSEQETKAFVMVGSANLTLSGWARNRECVAIRQIETTSQKEQVVSFFNSFCKPKELNLSDLGVLRAESLVNDWSLIFTHPNTTFINKLLDLQQREWKIWSPYFSDINCIENVRASFQKNGSEIRIIPDLLGKKIRMDNSTLENGDFTFYTDKHNKEFEGQMTHAKVWLSPHYLVLGSHNFTEPAMQHQNMEASIVIHQANDALFSSVTLEEVKVEPMNNDELKENNLQEKTGSFLVSVVANHKEHSITLSTEGLPPQADYLIILPGSVSLEIPKWHGNTKTIVVDHLDQFSQLDKSRFWKALVTDKQVLLKCVNQGDSDNKRGFGYIIETGLEARQAFQYDSLESLMLDVLSGYPADSSKRLVHLANIRDERELGINTKQNDELDYFHLFDFFYKTEQKFSKLKDENALFYSPNSLLSLKGLIEDKLKNSLDASKKVYLELLVHEFNALVERSLNKLEKDSISLNSLKISSGTEFFSKEQLEFIEKN